MKKHFFVILFCIASYLMSAQPHYPRVMQDAEAKNPTLQVAAKQRDAQQSAARTGVLLPDPEIRAAYYWGSPASIGIRWDLSVSQSFELPSVLVRRARLRDMQAHAATLDYQVLRNATLLEAQQICADIIYYRNIGEIYRRRCTEAIHLAELYQKRYSLGDCSVLDYNRTQMYLAKMQHLASEALLNADHALHDLQTLMGDNTYYYGGMAYDSIYVEASFEQWYDSLEMHNPYLQRLANEVEASRQQAMLSRALWLPSMSVGYASENVVGQTFRGVTVGLTLPLWSQQRAVRSATLQSEASQSSLLAQRTELSDRLRCLFHRHAAQINNVKNLQEAFDRCNSSALLDKALDGGEITLEQYLLQLEEYHQVELQLWQARHELEQLHLQLYAVEL